ncbi:MAG TPA: S-methyl-5-thioribose-1-phosphate isomerase, partial [Phaeodactylibacter sp.]|nr:S-methyl-5-thioribose-1-phosphate isomerase [Phaeodactylibacter sp.]
VLQKTNDRGQLALRHLAKAREFAATSKEQCRLIGQHGLPLLQALSEKKGGRLNILTHCNAGWLACVDYGTALAPIYAAFDSGLDVHVYVDETRPRNQGARLTAFELAEHGIPHTLIADNTGGHLMQHGMVDLVLVGSDRTTRTGDVGNKIGTYLKALAARDNGIPFYVALPTSSIDFKLTDGLSQIPIEKRGEEEIHYLYGLNEKSGQVERIRISPANSPAANYAFDITPARLVTGLITEHGICKATEEEISKLENHRP